MNVSQSGAQQWHCITLTNLEATGRDGITCSGCREETKSPN